MKIGLVLPGFSGDEHDWCIPALLDFVRRLAAEHTVHVFALEYPYRRDVYPVFGATVHSLNGQNRGKWYAPRLWSDTLSAIYAENRCVPFDLLHAFWANEPGLLALVAGRVLRVPVVVSVGGGELVGLRAIHYGGQLSMIERTLVRRVLRATDRVTVGSRYLQTIARHWRGDTQLLPLGVDARLFSPDSHGGVHRPIKILNVGSLIPVKGQMQLLRALATLTPRAVCLEIIGNGTLEEELRQEADALHVADRVEFSGAVSHDEMPPRYRAADVFVQASVHEAQGMAVLEAAACAVPIVGTPVGVVPELAETEGAIAASGLSADNLAAALESALRAREELGRHARERVERDYSLEVAWAKWIELYQQI